MKSLVLFFVVIIFITAPCTVQSQTIRAMDFRNQNITDILMILAEAARRSIIVDETVMGTATFHFSDKTCSTTPKYAIKGGWAGEKRIITIRYQPSNGFLE